MTSVSTHQIRVEEKQGETARLYRWACACGESGAVWYRGPVTAERTGSDHLDKVA